MSALYNLEPQPTAKVLLQTTSGDIVLELFAKQTPLTSRNFLQLCLDGYYNGTIFHRLVPGFIIQGGDPTGTGEGGEAIYDGGLFADEFHSRLKFNRRGLLGMANSGRKDDNGSQFFLTLGKTEELNGRNTMFGKIVGDTIYNLMKIGEADLVEGEGSERPLYPTKITGTEVLVNPFEDMISKVVRAKTTGNHETSEQRKKGKNKAGKTLLSFAEEGQDAEEEPILKRVKFNTGLISAPSLANGFESNHDKELMAKSKHEKSIRRQPTKAVSPPPNRYPSPGTQLPPPSGYSSPGTQLYNERPLQSPSTSPEPAQVEKISTLLERTNAQIAELKASMKRNIPLAGTETTKKKSALEQMIPEKSTRGRKRKHGIKEDKVGDAQALEILNAFRAKLAKAPPETSDQSIASPRNVNLEQLTPNVHRFAEDDEEAHLCDLHFIAKCQSCQSWDQRLTGPAEDDVEDDKGWMSHALSFEKDRLGKDLTWKRKNEEELVVIDPREKARSIREEQRARKSAKGSSSGKAWDRESDRGWVPDKLASERA